jgi:hypothetical protein
MQHPYDEPDKIEKIFVVAGVVAAVVFAMRLLTASFSYDDLDNQASWTNDAERWLTSAQKPG